MGKITRYFLLTDSINGINLYVSDIEIHLYPPPIFYLVMSNTLKSVLCMERSAVDQWIILSKSVMTWKRSLIIVTSSIRPV